MMRNMKFDKLDEAQIELLLSAHFIKTVYAIVSQDVKTYHHISYAQYKLIKFTALCVRNSI